MRPSERPPKHKKGIQILQPTNTSSKVRHPLKDSVSQSIQSTSRSRGISISR